MTIYPNDHRPAHVHVIGQGHEALFILNEPQGFVALRENYGFAKRDLARIGDVLEEHLALLVKAWEEIHGA